MKRLSRWSMAIVATFVLALSLVGGLAKQALADTTPVTSEAELLAAIAAAPADGSQTIVQVNADFTITAPVQVPANKNIRLMGTGTITSAMTGSNFYMFKIASGGAVTLDGATIDGNNTAFAVENRGSFTLLRGVIKNGKAKPTPGNNGVVLTTGAGAKFVMAGGTIQDSTVANALGGAVTVANGATGELRDGTIQNTTLTNQYSGSVLVRNADFSMPWIQTVRQQQPLWVVDISLTIRLLKVQASTFTQVILSLVILSQRQTLPSTVALLLIMLLLSPVVVST